ncbi:MAG: histidine--tRNA ligase [Eubacteriales bacterium]|jgi:histidyl-tRNA synthetase|nr:histidine--tRNA ligase [Eubacteriales bacterium]MDD3289630.1 histidine--tRNA ligase [Eubacteriales bacterium]MDD3863306.1 histidine--tRNA ligase [Eubacteriales bacterium]MDD4444554.1 histidine--tRNA ligase [Eubacteriales bacterium]
MIVSIPKGTKDILPSEVHRWQWLEDAFRDCCARYGFSEIRTPIFEHTELFKRGVGDTTDIVQKEMYTFELAGRSLTLKPEGTSPVVRAFIENKLYAEQMPAKYYYNIPCFRYEKMQKGRQRQFHQFGIEIFGTENMLADAEVIALAMDYLSGLGIDDLSLRINSIGCPNCRAKYKDALQNFLRPELELLCDTCKDRFDRNPMRILDCKSPSCKEITKNAPRMMDYICEDCRSAFEELKENLTALSIPYKIDTDIVRGLDYYTKTAFEIVSDKIGAQSTVCGGGRYDHLIEEIGGPPTPGVGFGMGIERLLLVLDAAGINISKPETCDVFIAVLGRAPMAQALKTAQSLRASGFKVLTDVMGRNLKAQLKYADRSEASYTMIIGEDELKKGVVTLRNMKESTQKEIKLEEIEAEIR